MLVTVTWLLRAPGSPAAVAAQVAVAASAASPALRAPLVATSAVVSPPASRLPASNGGTGRSDCSLQRSAPESAPDQGSDMPGSRDPRVAEAARRLRQRLLDSTDAYARAVGLWLDDPDRDDRLAGLVELALHTSDPSLYALAYRSCDKAAPNPASGCGQLNARRWAELDPGNGMPWLFLFEAAHRNADESGQQEALFHVGNAERIDDRERAPMGPIVDVTRDGRAGLMASRQLFEEAVGQAAAQSWPLAALNEACRGDRLADANRAQACLGVAALMAKRSDSLMMTQAGGAMATRFTGDPTWRERSVATAIALRANQPDLLSDDCGGVRRALDYERRVAAVGEVEALRERQRAARPSHR